MTDYNYDFVKVRVRDGIAWAALNRPEKGVTPCRLPCTMRWTTRWRGSRLDDDVRGRGRDRAKAAISAPGRT